MDKWTFNDKLFSRLSDVLDLKGTEIARRCGMRQQVLSRYMTNDFDVSVQVLMRMCNTLRMPIYYFVAEDGQYIIPNREQATIPYDRWHPVEWSRDAVERTFGDGGGRIYWKDVAVAMKVSSQKPHERFALRRRFKFTDFLSTCSQLGVSPFLFLIDRNRPGSTDQPGTGRTPDAPDSDSLQTDVAALRRQIAELTAAVSDTAGRYTALLKTHQTLLDRCARLERRIADIEADSAQTDMAAEP